MVCVVYRGRGKGRKGKWCGNFLPKRKYISVLDGGGDFKKWNYIYVLLKKEKKRNNKNTILFRKFSRVQWKHVFVT